MRAILQGAAGIAIGAILFWLALRDTDVDEILRLLEQIRLEWALAALICYATDITLRVRRWHVLLGRLVALPWYGVGEILVVGYTVNNILPARLGEIFRADYAKRRCGLTRSTVLGTIAIERLCDGVIVVLCLAGGLALLGPAMPAREFWQLALVALIAAGGVIGMTLLLIAVIRFQRALHWLPEFVVRRVTSLAAGLGTFTPRSAVPVIGLSAVVWLLEALGFWSIVRAVGLELGIAQSLVLVGAVSLSTLVPTAPAYVGSYQFMFALVFVAFGWAAEAGIVAASVAQVALMLPLTLLGLGLLILRGFHGLLVRPGA